MAAFSLEAKAVSCPSDLSLAMGWVTNGRTRSKSLPEAKLKRFLVRERRKLESLLTQELSFGLRKQFLNLACYICLYSYKSLTN